MNTMKILAVTTILSILAPRASGQWEPDGPNARLRIDQVSAALVAPLTHDIGVSAPGVLRIDVFSGANSGMGVILALANVDPNGSVTRAIPGLGSLNIGLAAAPTPLGIDLLADGISHTVNPTLDPLFSTSGNIDPRLALTYSLSPATTGLHLAMQCVVADPTMSPFGLDLTQCADVRVEAGMNIALDTTVSGGVRVAFPSGLSFPFHGVSYTELWVNADGFINFGGPSTIAPPSVCLNTTAFVTGRPAIAAWWADFAPTSGQVTATLYGDRLRVNWGSNAMVAGGLGVPHNGGNDRNSFSIELELSGAAGSTTVPGRFTLAYDGLNSIDGAHYGYGVMGYTPGGTAAFIGAHDYDFHSLSTSAVGMAVVEEHAVKPALGTLGYDGTGQRRRYNDMRSWNGQSITFTPFPVGSTTPALYFVSRVGPSASEVITSPVNAVTLGSGQTMTITGQFRHFDASNGALGSVVVDPLGLNLAATVLGVLDGTGTLPRSLPNSLTTSPFRNGEGLVVQFPALPASYTPSTVTIRVDFADGTRREFSSGISGRNVVTTYSLAPGSNIRHDLRSVGVSFFGEAYPGFYVTSNGLITFLSPPTPTSVSLVNFLTPSPIGPIPSVSSFWTEITGQGLNVVVTEKPATARVEVMIIGGNWQSAGTPFGAATIELSTTGDVFLTNTFLIPTTTFQTVVQGFTDQLGGYSSPGWFSGLFTSAPGQSFARSLSSAQSSINIVVGFLYDSPSAGLWTIM